MCTYAVCFYTKNATDPKEMLASCIWCTLYRLCSIAFSFSISRSRSCSLSLYAHKHGMCGERRIRAYQTLVASHHTQFKPTDHPFVTYIVENETGQRVCNAFRDISLQHDYKKHAIHIFIMLTRSTPQYSKQKTH